MAEQLDNEYINEKSFDTSYNEEISNEVDDFSSHIIENELFDLESLTSQIKNNDFCILHLNVRSLNANIENLELFLSNFNHLPSVIVCSETWNLSCPQYHNLDNYFLYYNDSKINKADGTVIFVNKKIKHSSCIEIVNNITFLSIIIKFKNINLKITSIYRCHKLKLDRFIPGINEFLNLNTKIKNHIIIGDFNIDLINGNNYSEEFINNFLEKEYVPHFNKITRPNELNNSGGTCIDNAFIKTSDFSQIASLKYMERFGDHYPIFVNLKFETPIENNTSFTKSINHNKLLNFGKSFDWQSVTKITDPNCAMDYLIKVLQDLINRSTIIHKNFKFRKKTLGLRMV